MNPNIAQEISLLGDFLTAENDLGIVIGAHQNLDTYAAALALYLSLTQGGKKVQIISKKAPTVEVSGLVAIDKVREKFSTGGGNNGKLIVALPYIKGEVEKVLFTEAPNTINFHLTAAAGRSITPFDTNDVKLIWEGDEGSSTKAVITVGVGSMDELNGVVDPNSTKIVNIDNYQGNSRFGDVILTDESFSSLSEIVSKLIKDLKLPMDVDIAQNILDGVLFATRNFTKPNTSPLAFEAASNAMYSGAQRKGEEQQQAQQQPRRDQQQSFGGGQRHDRQDRQGRSDQQNQPRQGQPRQRVNENDFPAMHMQSPRPQQNQQQPQLDNRRQNPQGSVGQPQNQPQPQNRPMNQPSPFASQNPAQDAEIVDEPQMAQPQDQAMPEEPQYNQPDPSEVPDDWLMPKVFKSSKNNN